MDKHNSEAWKKFVDDIRRDFDADDGSHLDDPGKRGISRDELIAKHKFFTKNTDRVVFAGKDTLPDNFEVDPLVVEMELTKLDQALSPISPKEAVMALAKDLEKADEEKYNSLKPPLQLLSEVVVHKPAGHWAVALLSAALPKKVYENVFAQAIADMRDEANEADAAGKSWLRRWIIARDHATLLVSLFLWLWGKILRTLWTAISSAS